MGMGGMDIFANDSALDFLDEAVDDLACCISAAPGVEQHYGEAAEGNQRKQMGLSELDCIFLPSAAILIRLCTRPANAPSQ